MANLTDTFNKVVDKLSPLFLLMAITWLCWGISRGFWLFLSPIQAPILADVPRIANAHVQASNPNTFNIFAQPPAKVAPPTAPAQPPSNLDLKGVMVAFPESNSSAVIAVNGKIKNYRMDDKLEGTNYTLSAVDWNSVTLTDVRDVTVIITLNEQFELDQTFEAGDKKSSRSNKSSVSTVPSRSYTPPKSMQPRTSPVQKAHSQSKKNLAESFIDSAADQLEQDAAGYLSSVGVLATGDGYEVTDAMSSGMRSRIGIRAGDKVISVNGQDVGSMPANDAKLLRNIKQSRKAEIKVKRGEKIITIRQSF